MDHRQVRRYWNRNAEVWTRLARAGYDVYRDYLNTPAFFDMLPDVNGLVGLDIGCGEGHNTRLLAQRGARMTAIDISEVFIRHANGMDKQTNKKIVLRKDSAAHGTDRPTEGLEDQGPLGMEPTERTVPRTEPMVPRTEPMVPRTEPMVPRTEPMVPRIDYQVASAVELPYPDASFDFATAFMSLMDVPETERAIAEVHRVLKPGGFLQFSITHPCFDTPHRRNLRDEQGLTYAYEVGDYFHNLQGAVTEWMFSAAPPEVREGLPTFKVPRFTRTISQWLNLLIETGFDLERIQEPCPDDETLRRCPKLQDARVVAYFLHIRARTRA